MGKSVRFCAGRRFLGPAKMSPWIPKVSLEGRRAASRCGETSKEKHRFHEFPKFPYGDEDFLRTFLPIFPWEIASINLWVFHGSVYKYSAPVSPHGNPEVMCMRKSPGGLKLQKFQSWKSTWCKKSPSNFPSKPLCKKSLSFFVHILSKIVSNFQT